MEANTEKENARINKAQNIEVARATAVPAQTNVLGNSLMKTSMRSSTRIHAGARLAGQKAVCVRAGYGSSNGLHSDSHLKDGREHAGRQNQMDRTARDDRPAQLSTL